MRFHFAAVPVIGGEAEAEELNRFLAAHRVLGIERQLIQASGASLWAICVTYTPAHAATGDVPSKKGRIDYREVLAPEQFALYARLRNLRKELCEREGVPPYAIFNNEQLAAMVQGPIASLREMGEIEGVGKSRLDKYGDKFLEVLLAPNKDGRADAPA